ncbi:hypothetical protein [Sinosporangium album]|nr:hypothetical protein [Sinosporangium album]
MGRPLQRPPAMGLNKVSAMTKIQWRSWGGATAVGVGEVNGLWCLPQCETKGYPATITLSNIRWGKRGGFYAGFTVNAPGLPEEQAKRLTDQRFSSRER